MTDPLENNDRVFLEKLMLATNVLLELGEDDSVIPATMESELWIFRERLERTMLLPGKGQDSKA